MTKKIVVFISLCLIIGVMISGVRVAFQPTVETTVAYGGTVAPCYVFSTDAGVNVTQLNNCLASLRNAINGNLDSINVPTMVPNTGGVFTGGTKHTNTGSVYGTVTAGHSAESNTIKIVTADAGYNRIQVVGNDFKVTTTLPSQTFYIQNSLDASIPFDMQLNGAMTMTGRITSTDGVASGTAKIIGGRAYVNTADGATLTNTTTETSLAQYIIPANTLKAGTVVKFHYSVVVPSQNSTDTLTVRLRFGASATPASNTALIATAATDVATDDKTIGEYTLTSRDAPGATSACVGKGSFTQPAAAGGNLVSAYLVNTNFATNGALYVDVTGQWSVAHANNQCHADILFVEIL